ncbi:acyltransferase [Streptomyces sp. NPDC048611]|uniref:acyltransferase family protein n=1 Tax=Streptomyces sp. NPDC048611 TaxID=3155635 RepID=UPI003420CA99
MHHLSGPSSEPTAVPGRPVGGQRGAPPPAAHGTSPAPKRLSSLTGLRFAAAVAVLYTHSMLMIDPDLAENLGPEVWVGGSAVSLFFILSGYVLTHSAHPDDTARAFWRRRAVKIFPNHIVIWCVIIAALIGTGASTFTGGAGIAAGLSSLFLVHTWVPSHLFVSAGNPVSWSLAAEVFFYLLFPVMLPWIKRLSPRGLLIGAATALAVVWSWPVFCALVVNPDGASFPEYWFLYMLPVTRLPEFVLGMIAARIAASGLRIPRIGVIPAALGVIGAVVINPEILPQRFLYAASTVAPLVMLVYATAELDLRDRRSVLRARPVVFLGELSYAMYLVHFLVLGLLYLGLRGHGWSNLDVVLLALPFVLLVSWLLHAGVERPCVRRFSTSRARARSRAAAAS